MPYLNNCRKILSTNWVSYLESWLQCNITTKKKKCNLWISIKIIAFGFLLLFRMQCDKPQIIPSRFETIFQVKNEESRLKIKRVRCLCLPADFCLVEKKRIFVNVNIIFIAFSVQYEFLEQLIHSYWYSLPNYNAIYSILWTL